MNQQNNGLTLAIATDDEKHLITRHFGDAKSYLIYQMDESGWVFLKKVLNKSEEEKIHADPVKAGSISGILKAEGVQVLVSKAFGPNIKRMIRKFACVLLSDESIETGLESLKRNYPAVLEKWEEGDGRSHLKI
jgi:predicted Fe-Mo cluster-binding NifX family protein